MRRLLLVIPIGLLPVAYAHESFTLLMASVSALFIATAANFTFLRSCSLVLASVSFAWTMVEALLSTIEGHQRAHIALYDRDTGDPVRMWRLHEAYGALPRPGTYNATKRTDEGALVYDVVYTIGPDGFRHTPQPLRSDGRHAYFLGDSATFGEGLNDDQTLPFHWATLNPEYRVTNLAISAWGLHQAYVVWRDLVVAEGALVFIQTAPWHADRSACIPDFSAFSPKFELVNDAILQNGKCRVIVADGLLGRVLRKSKIIGIIYDAFYNGFQTEKFELYVAIIKHMQALADQRHQCMIVAFNKALEAYFVGSAYGNEEIVQILKEAGIQVVDLTLASSKEDLDPSYYIAGDGHPTEKANQAKARLLSAAANACPAEAAPVSGTGSSEWMAAGPGGRGPKDVHRQSGEAKG